jgi:hypothetical protein
MHEEWRSVVGYEGLYEVSSIGRIRNIKGTHRSGRILIAHNTWDGYARLTLCKDGKIKMMCIHVMVAAAFLGARESRTVNHKDGIKSHNDWSNLEYLSRGDNSRHAARFELLSRGEGHGNSKLTLAKARTIKILLAKGGPRGFQTRIAERFGITTTAVGYIKRGKLWGWLNVPESKEELKCQTLTV